MIGFEINDLMSGDGLTLVPDKEAIVRISGYLEEEMDKSGVSIKDIYRMNIAVDEICSNIVNYSSAQWVKAGIAVTEDTVTVKFIDNGIPFDPLNVKEPDIKGSAEERELGGLGIFMTRKLMDEVHYSYENGCNRMILVLKRKK